MRINGIHIFINEKDELILEKAKGGRHSSYIYYFLIGALLVSVAVFIKVNRVSTEVKPVTIFFIIVFLGALCTVFYYQIKRTAKNNTSYILSIKSQEVFINGQLFCSLLNLKDIIVQEVNGWEGVGESFTVGLGQGKLFFPLTFNHNLEKSKAIAEIIANYFHKKIVIKEGKLFSLFRGH